MNAVRDRVRGLWQKYKYAMLVVLVGVCLMLLGGMKSGTEKDSAPSQSRENYSLEEVEQKMEAVLGQIQGVGRLRIMLTLKSASEIRVAEDTDVSREEDGSYDSRRQPITVNRGSGWQDVVVTGETYPVFQGAVVVCDGADDSAVRLAVTEAVAALTGLGSDKISIVKWQS